MKNKTLLMFWSSLELPAGIALIAAPSRVAKVLISTGLTPGGEAVGRLGGCALFSLAIALLAEELIFGQVFRLFFAKQAVAVKSGNKR